MANHSLLGLTDDAQNEQVDFRQPKKPKIEEESKEKVKGELQIVQDENYDDLVEEEE